jgi:hypothetical protein
VEAPARHDQDRERDERNCGQLRREEEERGDRQHDLERAPDDLDERFADELGIDLRDAGIREVEGRDETGNEYTRYFTTLRGDVRVPDSPALAQRDPDVMFQKIIYDGLVGHAFLRRFVVTYDLPHERLVFAQ